LGELPLGWRETSRVGIWVRDSVECKVNVKCGYPYSLRSTLSSVLGMGIDVKIAIVSVPLLPWKCLRGAGLLRTFSSSPGSCLKKPPVQSSFDGLT
jgi:hypothetical protein